MSTGTDAAPKFEPPQPFDGGPAFPTEPNTQPGHFTHHGMSLRDWFAGQALIAVLTGPMAVHLAEAARERGVDNDAIVAIAAYETADAMLAARGAK